MSSLLQLLKTARYFALLAGCGSLLFAGYSAHAEQATASQSADAVVAAKKKQVKDLHLLDPIWSSPTTHRESVMFVADEAGRPATGKLLFPATKILAIHSADGGTSFEMGKDCELSADGRELLLLKGSRIPHLNAEELFPPAGAPRTIPQKADDAERHVLFENGHWFHDQQVEVTYEHDAPEWDAPIPTVSREQLPHVLAKLKAGKPVTIGVSGDSISAGGNASGMTNASPGMPAFPELVAAQLEKSYGSKVTLHNRAVGGWTSPQGAGDLDALLETKPELVIIAYGMNDVGYRNAEAFQKTIAGMLERIRQANAETDVILVAPMTGNPQWIHTPAELFPLYRDALAALTGPGVALADLTSTWQHILHAKRDVDLTGNGVNHPNDFGHRLYAQTILALLVEPNEAP